MHIISVNIGKEQPIKNAKPSGKTGIYKLPQESPVKVTLLGLKADAICDTENHGGYEQAVYVYGAADYNWWANELGQTLAPGTFGENLTISGLQSADYCAGDRLILASGVVLEVTSPRIPCVTLAARMGDPQFVKKFRHAGRPGLYCRIIVEGYVQAKEEVVVERYQGETVTIMEMFNNFYLPLPNLDYLRRFLQAPTHTGDRAAMQAKYEKALSSTQKTTRE